MRFNKEELASVALLPANKFEKQGVLFMTEKQDGFFRRAEVSCRWCRLRGNLLFYFKDDNQFSMPFGLIVLEHCRPVIKNEKKEEDGYVFFIEFFDGLYQQFATRTNNERSEWVAAIKSASYTNLNKKIQLLQEKLLKSGQNERINPKRESSPITISNKGIDISEVPICESAILCDNLLCDGQGRAPNPFVRVEIKQNSHNDIEWKDYGRTETIERCSNPQFLCTITFRESQGLSMSSIIRFTCYDVREKFSCTSIPIGFVEISLSAIKETTHLRTPLRSVQGNSGFITIISWTSGNENKKSWLPPANITHVYNLGHRRTQSLPQKFGNKLFVPSHNKLQCVFTNPLIHSYRMSSGLGGDISVLELMMESKICYLVPQQLLSIWISREKELLQEISGMGELGGEWRNKQMDLLDKHLKLLKDYSQARQNLEQIKDKFYKKSVNKTDESIEFVPVNLHLQRLCINNDTLKRSGILDVITVGAFTRHSGKKKTGGLIKLLQQVKDSSIKVDQYSCKVEAANDVVQAIKHLRKEIVEIMTQLLTLAKFKNPKGMLPLCNEIVNKTRTLLEIWEPSLVEEALTFIEQNRIIETDDSHMPTSPFKKITQQLDALDLKSPDLEDFATPIDPWPKNDTLSIVSFPKGNSSTFCTNSQNSSNINAISAIQNSVKIYNQICSDYSITSVPCEASSTISESEEATESMNNEIKFNETYFNIKEEESQICETSSNGKISTQKNNNIKNQISDNEYNLPLKDDINVTDSKVSDVCFTVRPSEIVSNCEEIDYNPINCTILLGHNGYFLDVKEMNTSPSANYYRPTEEPEPLDLTQLNIEASVMCLLSKIKFLCGRCGSPAVRLRQRKTSLKRVFNTIPPPAIINQENNLNNIQQNGSCSNNKVDEQNVKILNTSGARKNEKDLTLTEVTKRSNTGNKFTDGLDLATDWVAELRPSMRKLRQAMDGLLKTSRLMHSVQRLQQDMRRINLNLAIMYRRDVCFSQALTSLISGLMARLWGTTITDKYLQVLSLLGPLAYFEGLLSLYGNETDMWGDMCVAIEDLSAVTFTLVRNIIQRDNNGVPVPKITGSRQSLNVFIPIPENIYEKMSTHNKEISFKVTPVFFNIGINEKATVSEALGYTKDQHRSNWDNFDRLKQYYIRFKKLNLVNVSPKLELNLSSKEISDYLQLMEDNLRNNISKNVNILHLSEDISRAMYGLRFTSCKSAKDRTGMAVTLEQCRILQQEFHLPSSDMQKVLNTIRIEGTRADNVVKNIGKRKYAFNLPQVLSLPLLYRPPAGSYGKVET